MFTHSVEYALRAVVHLASVAPASRTTQQLAEATRVPQPYLAKLLHRLVQAGLVWARRGSNGGVSLAQQPADVTVLQVINAVSPIRRISLGAETATGRDAVCCPIHERINAILALAEEGFASVTLAEAATASRGPVPCPR
jgi:Rrf2 family protein